MYNSIIMALITSPTETMPDLNYEYHTITFDSVGQNSSNNFTVFLNNPLNNVVQAKLLAAHIHTTDHTEHCYLSIEELNSIFSDRTSNVYEGQGDITTVRGSFASLISEPTSHSGSDSLIVYKDNYNMATQFINPIRKIDRLTVTLRNQAGETIKNSTTSGSNFFIVRFVCRKPNL